MQMEDWLPPEPRPFPLCSTAFMTEVSKVFCPIENLEQAGSSKDTSQEGYILLFPQFLSLQLAHLGS